MISVIIVDFNTIHKTIDYIKRFRQNVFFPEKYHFIIVDNFAVNNHSFEEIKKCVMPVFVHESKDGTIWKIELEGMKFLYCRAKGNLGFARGNNFGVKVSKEIYKDNYYLFSNNDIIFKEKFDTDRIFTIFEENPDIGIIGFHVIGLDGKEQSPYKKISTAKQLVFNYWGYMMPFYNVKGDLDYDGKSKFCYWVSGCFFVTRAEVFESVNGFDENTFLYAEEMILSERYARRKYKVFFDNDFTIIHEGGATVRKTKTPLDIMEIKFNSLCYYHKIYRNTSCFIINVAESNFKIYKVVTKIKNIIKKIGNK